MNHRSLALLVLVCLALAAGPTVSATCGGGGGGGMGGIAPEVFPVPWKVTDSRPESAALTLLWFPTNPAEAKSSDLLESRYLATSAGQCVAFVIAPDTATALRTRYEVSAGQGAVVLAAKSGEPVGRLAGAEVKLSAVEKLLRGEIDRRRKAADATLDEADAKLKAGETETAVTLYQQLVVDRCLLSGPAKKAGKALKKLGREVPPDLARYERVGDPDLSDAMTEKLTRLLEQGVKAENEGRLADAEAVYREACAADPNDPAPLRYLAEYHRHHSGDWRQARELFGELLERPADPLSHAVALHGLGKMTIHAGDFQKGLGLMEQSVATFPLPLAYRNLAVYWNSEKEPLKAHGYVLAALALDPEDLYNRIFAATYLAELGRQDEARRIAEENEHLLPASYNLAAIWAQLGDKERALALLYRHFFLYEQFPAVRYKEMQEARDDYTFASLHQDPGFLALTADAARDDESYHRNR
ncbi:MAG: tetratricopeptide repeat protein [Thermoanaerobaculia bacterium]|nr:tetratricopeptide repeat protein [Thermoanaerobaculia bacterium]